MYPSSQRFKSLTFTRLFSCGLAMAARAEPIRVTGGYIQVGAAGDGLSDKNDVRHDRRRAGRRIKHPADHFRASPERS